MKMLGNWKNWCRLCAKPGTLCNDEVCEMESVTNDQLELVEKHFKISLQYFIGADTVCRECSKFLIKVDGFREHCMKIEEMFKELLLLQENVKDFHLEFIRFKFGIDKNENCESITQIQQYNDPLVEDDDIAKISQEELDNDQNKSNLSPSNANNDDIKKVEVEEQEDIESLFDHDMGGVSDFDLDVEEDLQEIKEQEKSEKTIYTCEICSKSYKKKVSMLEHIKIKHHPEELPFVCSKCPKRFINKKRLTKHEDTHLPKNKRLLHSCPHCGKEFKGKCYLKLHVTNFHEKGKQFVCEDCGNSYMTKHALDRHRISHIVIHSCSRCPEMTFKNRRRLLEHMRTHDRPKRPWEKDRICAYCSKVFHRRNSLRDHMMTRHIKNGKTFACSQCPKRFATKRNLTLHKVSHVPSAERRIHPCPCCDKKFVSKNSVKHHIKYTHSKEKTFVCEECGKSYATKAILDEHKSTHTEERPFNCSFCHKAFKNLKQVKQHESSHKKDGHECPHCGLKLKSVSTLRLHLVIHSDVKRFKCNQCGNEYKRSQTLKDHLITHTGQRPYQCPFCDKNFANGSNYRAHKRKAHAAEVAALEASGKKIFPQNIPKLGQLQPKL